MKLTLSARAQKAEEQSRQVQDIRLSCVQRKETPVMGNKHGQRKNKDSDMSSCRSQP